MRALVVFGDVAQHPLVRWCKPGFKHCAVFLRFETCWLGVDGGCGGLVLRETRGDFDVAAWARGRGLTVVETKTRPKRGYRIFGRVDCLGTVKAALGLKKPFVLTPWQLYCYLLTESKAG